MSRSHPHPRARTGTLGYKPETIGGLVWSRRYAPSWHRLARQFKTAIGVFRSAPLEAQLFALLVVHHPRLFGILLAEATCKQGS
jgi:hypothetical protein